MPQPRQPRTTKPPPQRGGQTKPPAQGELEVDLPSGGRLRLKNSNEVQAWNESMQRYIADYGLIRANDLMLLGAILSQGIAMFRAQQDLADEKKATQAQGIIIKAATEIRDLEKALGIDKKSREAGGQHTVKDYVTRLKRAAHAKGVHLTERMKRTDKFAMELRWRIRLLRNGDDEDRAHHGITQESVISFAEAELAELEAADRRWAHEQGEVFAGRL